MKIDRKQNKILYWIIIGIFVPFCFLGRLIPIPGLSSAGSGVIFIFISCLVLWLTIGIDWPSILCIVSLGLLNYKSFGEVLADGFGNVTLIFLLFSFACTYALSKTSIIKRIIYAFIGNKLARKNGYYFFILFLTSVLLIGLFTPTVLFTVVLVIVEELFQITKISKNDKIAKAMLIGLGFTVSISSGMTPIAHEFPILAMNAAGVTNFPTLTYISFAIPVGFIIFGIMIGMFCLYLRGSNVNKITNVNISQLKKQLPPINIRDIFTLVIFSLVIVFWILPGLLQKVSPVFYNQMKTWTIALPPLIGVVLLCAIQINDRPLLKITDALKEGIPWPSMLICAATLTLCKAFEGAKVDEFIKNLLGNNLSNLAPIAVLIIFGFWAGIQTNISSNTITANLVAGVAGSLIFGGVQLNLVATAGIIGMLASLALAMPSSAPHIALVASNKYCDSKTVLIFGSILALASIICVLCIGYPIAAAMA